MTKRVYITTPIYYANGAPHIGTAYTSLIGDVQARGRRMLGAQVKFTTGTDENGQKMLESARAEGKEVMEYLDEIAGIHKATWDEMKISYTDFIRTTHEQHKSFVQGILEEVHEKGDVYQGDYEGMYCVGCEAFKKKTDLVEQEGKMVCPDHLKEPKKISEKNRFFSLKKYEEQLKSLYKEGENFCHPSYRYNEIKSFVEQGLEDFSISREGGEFGIQLPESFNDASSVVYIWFDALFNYVTTCEKPQFFTKNGESVSGEENDMVFWNDAEVIHTIGKDISRFHAIFWPAMLMSTGYKVSDLEIINGFFTVDGQKMSKSLGNKIDPLELVNEHGRDALVYYLFSDIKIGNDGDFSRERFAVTKDSILKKGRGNLVSRVAKLSNKYGISEVSLDHNDDFFKLLQGELSSNKLAQVMVGKAELESLEAYYKEADYFSYLRDWFALVQFANQYMQNAEPWRKIKDPETEDLARKDLQAMIRCVKSIGILSAPYLIEGFSRLQEIFQINNSERKNYSLDENSGGISESTALILGLNKFEINFGEGFLYT